MENLRPEQREVLLHIHQTQHEQSLSHRQSILTAFGLAIAGLMALTGGAIAPGYMPQNVKCSAIVAVVIVWLFMVYYIRSQRVASEKAFKIIRLIDKRLELFERDKYLLGESVLPEGYAKPQKTLIGLLLRVDFPLIITFFSWFLQ